MPEAEDVEQLVLHNEVARQSMEGDAYVFGFGHVGDSFDVDEGGKIELVDPFDHLGKQRQEGAAQFDDDFTGLDFFDPRLQGCIVAQGGASPRDTLSRASIGSLVGACARTST